MVLHLAPGLRVVLAMLGVMLGIGSGGFGARAQTPVPSIDLELPALNTILADSVF